MILSFYFPDAFIQLNVFEIALVTLLVWLPLLLRSYYCKFRGDLVEQ